jgi:hypothetical protein
MRGLRMVDLAILGSGCVFHQMAGEKEYGHEKQQMYHHAGDVKHGKAGNPDGK